MITPSDPRLAAFTAHFALYSQPEFLIEMYRRVFDRGLDETGYVTWLTQLYAGYPREHLVAAFLNSEEFTASGRAVEAVLCDPALLAAPLPEPLNIDPLTLEQYQDVWIRGRVASRGVRECDDRYQIIKGYCAQFNRPFTILDIGANLGYFSIRLCEDLDCTSVLVEGIYGDWLQEVLEANSNQRLILLKKLMSLDDLRKIAEVEHFDVVMALSVIHHFPNDINESLAVLQSLGDHLILELPNEREACGQDVVTQAMQLQLPEHARFLGRGKSHLNEGERPIVAIHTPKTTLQRSYIGTPREGLSLTIHADFSTKTVEFHNKPSRYAWHRGINLQTYLYMHGAYPSRAAIAEMVAGLTLNGAPHRDVQPWNLILQGDAVQLIDADDPHHAFAYSDEQYLARIADMLNAGYKAHYQPVEDGDPVQRELGVFWSAPFFNYSGYATAARFYAEALHASGVHVAANPFGTNLRFTRQMPPASRTVWKDLVKKSAETGILLVSTTPVDPDGFDVLRSIASNQPDKRAYICYTVNESNRIPENWVPSLAAMDEVWVPSWFCREAFVRSGLSPTKVIVIPHGVDLELYDPANIKPLDIPGAHGTVFLSIFEWSLRKGWDVLLDAWHRAFTAADDVTLVIRAYRAGKPAAWIAEQIRAWRVEHGHTEEGSPRILVLDRFLAPDEMPALYAAAHAFVLPSRGEGWGLPYMEAMSMGVPAIGTQWGGNLDFMDEHNSYLIRCEETPVPDSGWQDNPNAVHYHHQVWAEPDADHLAELLRHVHQNPLEASSKGQHARQEMLERFNPEVISRRMLQRLARYWTQPARRVTMPKTGAAQPDWQKLAAWHHIPVEVSPGKPNGVKVLLVARPDVFTRPSNDTLELLASRAALLNAGCTVDVDIALNPRPSGQRIAHLIAGDAVDVALLLARHLRWSLDMPLVVTLAGRGACDIAVDEAFHWRMRQTQIPKPGLEPLLALFASGRVDVSAQDCSPAANPDHDADLADLISLADAVITTPQHPPVTGSHPNLIRPPRALPALNQPAQLLDETASEPAADLAGCIIAPERVCQANNQLALLIAARGAPDLPPLVLNTAFADPAYLQLCRMAAPENTRFEEFADAVALLAAMGNARVVADAAFSTRTGPYAALAACMGKPLVAAYAAADVHIDPLDIAALQAGLRQAVILEVARLHPGEMLTQPAHDLLTMLQAVLKPDAASSLASPERRFRALITSSLTHVRSGNPQQALTTLNQHLQVQPNDARAWAFAGHLSLALGAVKAAVPCYERLSILQPGRYQPVRQKLELARMLGDIEQAKKVAQEVIRLRPLLADGYLVLAQMAWNARAYADIVDLLIPALDKIPDHIGLLIMLGDAYRALRRYDNARQTYERVLELDGNVDAVLPHLLSMPSETPVPTAQAASVLSPRQVFEAIITAPDLLAALQEYEPHFTPQLIDLIEGIRASAQEGGQADVASGLQNLIDYIQPIVAAKG